MEKINRILKKKYGNIFQQPEDKIKVIKVIRCEAEMNIPINYLCDHLCDYLCDYFDVSQSGYYFWSNKFDGSRFVSK